MAEEKKDALAVVAGLEGMISTARPEGADEGLLGNEGIGREDILMPRLGLAQKMSPEIDMTNPRYIDGLKFTEMFNSMTKQNYGTGPLHFLVLRRYDPRYIEFKPIDEGGGIVDRNVPPNDPRTKFGPNGEKPVATMFYDFVILLLNNLSFDEPLQNVIGFSLKSSGIKAAKHLNFLINQRGKKLICKGIYSVTTGHEVDKKSQGTYAVFKIKNAGWVTPNTPLEALALELFESWKDRDAPAIDVEAHNADEAGDASFSPEQYEQAAAAAGAKSDM